MRKANGKLEIVVIDDGSTDRTREIVEAFADPRIKYLWQANTGQGVARNHGMRQCAGYYITRPDADDYYVPAKLEREAEFLEGQSRYSVAYYAVSGRIMLKRRKLELFVPLALAFPTMHFSWTLGFFKRVLTRDKPGTIWLN